jgi:hypothetical protein
VHAVVLPDVYYLSYLLANDSWQESHLYGFTLVSASVDQLCLEARKSRLGTYDLEGVSLDAPSS